MTPIADDAEYRALLGYSARIGRDPALIQGAGGNVSLKRDGILWVKASGTWLMEAESRDIMVPVELAPLHAAIESGEDAENLGRFVATALNTARLRPSIETTMHAVLPHRVVVHVHCVETIAWAVRSDAETAIAPLLDGLRWCFVPYIRPGAPLTRLITQRMRPGTDVLVLGNHGLVVGGHDTQSAASLLEEVVRRLRRVERKAPAADLDRLRALSRGTRYQPAEDPVTHGIGTDAASLALARIGSLYPDHVIFLGPNVPVWPDAADRPICVVPGEGVLLRDDASAGAVALARCLADVTARLDPAEPIVALTEAQEAELLGWEAEAYRRSLPPR